MDVAKLVNKSNCDVINETPTRMKMYLSEKQFKYAICKLKIVTIGARFLSKNYMMKLWKILM